MSRTIDTSALFALLDAADPHHEAAQAAMADPEPVLVDPAILYEWLQLVRHRRGRAASLAAWQDIRALPHIRYAAAPRTDAVANIMQRHGRLSWQDASCIATALAEGTTLLTYDERQRAVFAAMGGA